MATWLWVALGVYVTIMTLRGLVYATCAYQVSGGRWGLSAEVFAAVLVGGLLCLVPFACVGLVLYGLWGLWAWVLA